MGLITKSVALARLEHIINVASLDECPLLIFELERLRAMAWIRMLNAGKPLGRTAPPGDDELLTIPQVAQRLKVSRYRAYELARQGVLASVRLGKSVRVKPSAIDEYLARMELEIKSILRV